MGIRKAVIDDVDKITLLCKEQFRVMANLQPYLYRDGEQNKEFLESIITDMDSEIFVVEQESEIIGFVSVFEKETSDFSFRIKHRYAYVMDIITTNNFRGKGFATEMIAMVKEWALVRDLDYIELSVLANNTATEFYKKMQFKETACTMICKL